MYTKLPLAVNLNYPTVTQARANRGNIGELANNPENHDKSDFCIIWQLGGSGMVQNTPTGSGNDLPTRGTHFQKLMFSTFVRLF